LINVLVHIGKYAEGHALSEQSISALDGQVSRRFTLTTCLLASSAARMHLGQHEDARTLASRALALAREINSQEEIASVQIALGCLALAEEAFTEARGLLQRSVTILQGMAQRLELSEALANLGYAECGLGHLERASQHLYEALRTASTIPATYPLMFALPAIALVQARQGRTERAVELYTLASRYPVVANSLWFEAVAGKHVAAAAAALPPDVVAAAQERGRARDLWATVEELLIELGKEGNRR
jgi:tetratricopeptide (TPR) repeat protein